MDSSLGERFADLERDRHLLGRSSTAERVAAILRDRITVGQLPPGTRLVEEAMQAGAYGLSTGLEFEPGRHARTEELVRLATVAGGGEPSSIHHTATSFGCSLEIMFPRSSPRRRQIVGNLPITEPLIDKCEVGVNVGRTTRPAIHQVNISGKHHYAWIRRAVGQGGEAAISQRRQAHVSR